MVFALECQVQFPAPHEIRFAGFSWGPRILEERTEAYKWYAVGVPQRKIVPGAKRPAGQPALLGDGPAVANTML